MLDWHTHTLSVHAEPTDLLSNPQEFTMQQLAEDGLFDVLELPVTLACDGNRRGEVNSIKKRYVSSRSMKRLQTDPAVAEASLGVHRVGSFDLRHAHANSYIPRRCEHMPVARCTGQRRSPPLWLR
jgi:hypothetical protein